MSYRAYQIDCVKEEITPEKMFDTLKEVFLKDLETRPHINKKGSLILEVFFDKNQEDSIKLLEKGLKEYEIAYWRQN